ncbi:hypothetical protein BCR44DRAFT_1463068 [Catenaria anguillulae PL171]|uniref:Uncharacterized protein n=1 Tax=Catenaria anguillulae PL171 TaxID=765915 RepID=A0A1Y2HD61_9FUNG|nr:hypothetical protein BCR44DRAFT_1463068 [Catenaria anguillulae PL171]
MATGSLEDGKVAVAHVGHSRICRTRPIDSSFAVFSVLKIQYSNTPGGGGQTTDISLFFESIAHLLPRSTKLAAKTQLNKFTVGCNGARISNVIDWLCKCGIPEAEPIFCEARPGFVTPFIGCSKYLGSDPAGTHHAFSIPRGVDDNTLKELMDGKDDEFHAYHPIACRTVLKMQGEQICQRSGHDFGPRYIAGRHKQLWIKR